MEQIQASQTSANVYLQQGRKYYIEVLHKDDLGDDNLSVGWKLPNSTSIAVIPGSQLAPFNYSTARLAADEEEIVNELSLNVFPNPATASSQIQLEAQALESEEEVLLTIHNNVGRLVYKEAFKTNVSGMLKEGISLQGNISSGLYFFTLRSKKGVLNQKIFISN
jgi:xyloglucan-specific exo-beta-1,4-glucanase